STDPVYLSLNWLMASSRVRLAWRLSVPRRCSAAVAAPASVGRCVSTDVAITPTLGWGSDSCAASLAGGLRAGPQASPAQSARRQGRPGGGDESGSEGDSDHRGLEAGPEYLCVVRPGERDGKATAGERGEGGSRPGLREQGGEGHEPEDVPGPEERHGSEQQREEHHVGSLQDGMGDLLGSR